jgi:outer membrane immunogenic protein
MKKLAFSAIGATALLSSAWTAQAADLRRAPPPVAPPVYAPAYNWTGFYVGGNLGGAWSNIDVTGNFTGARWSTDNSNFIIGGQVGYNYQFYNRFVLGIEWDFDWANGDKSSAFVTTVPFGPVQATIDNNWVTTLAARLGYAADRWFFYAKLGAGWTKIEGSLRAPGGGVIATGSTSNVGWLVGAGVEYAFTQNWTAKIEYNYLGLDDKTFATTVAPNTVTVSPDLQMVKAGFNYKF